MRIRPPGAFPFGFTPVARAAGLEFGLLRLRAGESWEDAGPLERAFLLIGGAVRFECGGVEGEEERGSLLGELPATLHAPAGERVRLHALAEAELAVHAVPALGPFPPRLIRPEEVRVQRLALGRFPESTERTLRTVLDGEADTHSAMTMGEIVSGPGRWSSYPPHHHPHPEIYHYRFHPANGFGYAGEGEEVYEVRGGDTACIEPHRTHPQVTAPGYTMIYIWSMPHLPGDRFGPRSRLFEARHEWVLREPSPA